MREKAAMRILLFLRLQNSLPDLSLNRLAAILHLHFQEVCRHGCMGWKVPFPFPFFFSLFFNQAEVCFSSFSFAHREIEQNKAV